MARRSIANTAGDGAPPRQGKPYRRAIRFAHFFVVIDLEDVHATRYGTQTT